MSLMVGEIKSLPPCSDHQPHLAALGIGRSNNLLELIGASGLPFSETPRALPCITSLPPWAPDFLQLIDLTFFHSTTPGSLHSAKAVAHIGGCLVLTPLGPTAPLVFSGSHKCLSPLRRVITSLGWNPLPRLQLPCRVQPPSQRTAHPLHQRGHYALPTSSLTRWRYLKQSSPAPR